MPQKPLFDVTDGNTLNGRETLKGKAKSPLYNASLLNNFGSRLRRISRVELTLAGDDHVEEKKMIFWTLQVLIEVTSEKTFH